MEIGQLTVDEFFGRLQSLMSPQPQEIIAANPHIPMVMSEDRADEFVEGPPEFLQSLALDTSAALDYGPESIFFGRLLELLEQGYDDRHI